MSSPASPEREQPARGRRNEDDSAGESAPEARPSPKSARSTAALIDENVGQRFWVLPTASGAPLAVMEENDPWAMSEALRAAPPVVLTPSAGSEKKSSDCARERVQSSLTDRFQEAVFNFGTRFVIGLAWMLVAVGTVRIPGIAKIVGDILFLCGVGFTAYTVLRYGYGAVRWHNRRVDAAHAFAGVTPQTHPLAARLAAALELRRKLKPDERGKSPDAELLDSNAYRKLIDEGVTSVKELVMLGSALETQLGLLGPDGHARKVGEIAQENGIDTETVIFYRDLAAAAADIALQEKVKIDG